MLNGGQVFYTADISFLFWMSFSRMQNRVSGVQACTITMFLQPVYSFCFQPCNVFSSTLRTIGRPLYLACGSKNVFVMIEASVEMCNLADLSLYVSLGIEVIMFVLVELEIFSPKCYITAIFL